MLVQGVDAAGHLSHALVHLLVIRLLLPHHTTIASDNARLMAWTNKDDLILRIYDCVRMHVWIAYHVHDVLECCLRLAVMSLPEGNVRLRNCLLEPPDSLSQGF
jgi:hypothetical protein